MELSKIAWNFFKNSGDIEFYILYQEMELQGGNQDSFEDQTAQNE